MDGWMYGCRVELLLLLLIWLRVTIADNTSSTEAINFTARARFSLAATEVTEAYATAAANPLLGK